MLIGLFANIKARHTLEVAQEVSHFLQKQNVRVVARDDEADALGLPPLSSVSIETLQFAISLGGDGTILRLVHHYPDLVAPILGINLGHLGFMAEVPHADLYPSLLDLLKGAFTVERRLVMEGRTTAGNSCFAVNEIVIHRAHNPSLIDLSIHVDGAYLNTFSADGIIFSTPSGSTAYSLAAGGPILSPDLQAFVITPISPHTISNRPIVLMPHNKIEIQYLSNYDTAQIIYDGFPQLTLATHEILTLSRAARTFNMVHLHRCDYFATWRTKLGWTGQIRYGALNHRIEDRD